MQYFFLYKAIKDCLSDEDISEQNINSVMVGGDSLSKLNQSMTNEQKCLIPDIVNKGEKYVKESFNGDIDGQIIDVKCSTNMEGSIDHTKSVELNSEDKITTINSDQVDKVDKKIENCDPVTQSVFEAVRYSNNFLLLTKLQYIHN